MFGGSELEFLYLPHLKTHFNVPCMGNCSAVYQGIKFGTGASTVLLQHKGSSPLTP